MKVNPEWQVITGDCLDVMRGMEANSIDTIITDPPAGISMMGKSWDSDRGGRSQWVAWLTEVMAEGLRVLKPGGMALVWALPRTSHWTALAVEDAGFEIREKIYHIFGQGFPKSLDIEKAINKAGVTCQCQTNEIQSHYENTHTPDENMPNLRQGMDASQPLPSQESDVFPRVWGKADKPEQEGQDASSAPRVPVVRKDIHAKVTYDDRRQILQSGVLLGVEKVIPGNTGTPKGNISQRHSGGEYAGEPSQEGDEGREESGVEGRGDLPQASGELRVGSIRAMPAGVLGHGPERWVRNGASASNGSTDRAAATQNGNGSSPRSQSPKQLHQQSGTMAGQPQPQDGRSRATCGRCGKPIVDAQDWHGYGTSLKPSAEEWIVAMKPLSSTFAANALEWGVAGLWIDGGRVETDENTERNNHVPRFDGSHYAGGKVYAPSSGDWKSGGNPSGRWPANVIHDGSAEVLAGFPVTHGAGAARSADEGTHRGYHDGVTNFSGGPAMRFGDTGSAARFFYCAKASRAERNAGLPEGITNIHPTVKSLAIMRYLCRLTKTPTGGIVLDPFAGSGSTGCAAVMEGRSFIGIELSDEYAEIARARIAHAEKQAPVAEQGSLL